MTAEERGAIDQVFKLFIVPLKIEQTHEKVMKPHSCRRIYPKDLIHVRHSNSILEAPE